MTTPFDPQRVAGRLKQAGVPVTQAAVLVDELGEFAQRLDALEDDMATTKIDLNARIDAFKVYVEARFNALEERLNALEERLIALEERFEARFKALEGRLGALEARLDALEARLAALEAKVRQLSWLTKASFVLNVVIVVKLFLP